MSDKDYGPHEVWCDTENNISELCNCIASEYIGVIEVIKKENAQLKEKLEIYRKELLKAYTTYASYYEHNSESDEVEGYLMLQMFEEKLK